MSRKYARPPDGDLLTISKAIALERARLVAEGKRPVTVVLGPELWAAYRAIWGQSAVKELLGMRAELAEGAEGWVIRCRE